MSYRPITDLWILARPKVKYYGAYPNGFLERARALLGVHRCDPVLHVCGGHAKQYPAWATLSTQDRTLDLDPETQPDFRQDARDVLPLDPTGHRWLAIICDPPYTETDAQHYRVEADKMPTANGLLKNALAAVRVGGRVGMLHYLLPQPPRDGVKFIACVGVIVGYNNRIRVFSVFERLSWTTREELAWVAGFFDGEGHAQPRAGQRALLKALLAEETFEGLLFRIRKARMIPPCAARAPIPTEGPDR